MLQNQLPQKVDGEQDGQDDHYSTVSHGFKKTVYIEILLI